MGGMAPLVPLDLPLNINCFAGANAFMIDIWAEKSGPYLQALHFILMVGSTACPQLAKLFISPNPGEASSISSNSSSHMENTRDQSANSSSHVEKILIQSANSSSYVENILVQSESKVHYTYICISLFAVLGAIFHVANIIASRCSLKHIHVNSTAQNLNSSHSKNTVVGKTIHEMSKTRSTIALTLLCLIIIFFGGIEETNGAFLVSFSVNKLEFSPWLRERPGISVLGFCRNGKAHVNLPLPQRQT